MTRSLLRHSLSALVSLVALSLLTVTAVRAEQLRSIDTEPPQEIVNGMANKAARGIANTATGWLELPKQIYLTWKDDGAVKGIFVGPLKGIGMTLVRTISGMGELATFFVAYPGFYDPYFDPEYVWQKE